MHFELHSIFVKSWFLEFVIFWNMNLALLLILKYRPLSYLVSKQYVLSLIWALNDVHSDFVLQHLLALPCHHILLLLQRFAPASSLGLLNNPQKILRMLLLLLQEYLIDLHAKDYHQPNEAKLPPLVQLLHERVYLDLCYF